ncbi:hypothetical protein HHK36_002911 [Tetracentron sinense]|uniref:FAD-binding domain-containing protein n=1 Tax=Tetracentron sinense TaxID=13715 RepID=A0A835DN70_TETSI|nr:hypothetical protein HHK36_002911 [Tetracentron sinense]
MKDDVKSFSRKQMKDDVSPIASLLVPEMEIVEDIVIVGGGIAGLSTSLGLHRKQRNKFNIHSFVGWGSECLVLESSGCLRTTGYAFTIWANAWKALDALGIGDLLRKQHEQLHVMVAISAVSGLATSEMPLNMKGRNGDHEFRCVRRKLLLEALAAELPPGTIRYSSKVVSIEESGYLKLLHLADGPVIKTKVLIGCDGVNSVVAKWLGLQKPAFTGRSSIRGTAEFPGGHGFEPKFFQFFGEGFRDGFLPINDKIVYWFFNFYPCTQDGEDEEKNPAKLKQIVLSKLGEVPKEIVSVIENTELENIISSPLRLRWPWNVLMGDIYKGNVCVAGDALHPMTPDMGQGACAALEGVILARCLRDAFSTKPRSGQAKEKLEGEEYGRINKGLKKFAKERRWRSFELISLAYVVGWVQHSDGKVMNYLRDKWLSAYLAGLLLKKADFDCGKLSIP